jgi:hypothetical protein
MKMARSMKPAKLRVVILVIGILLTGIYFYKGYFAGKPAAAHTSPVTHSTQ